MPCKVYKETKPYEHVIGGDTPCFIVLNLSWWLMMSVSQSVSQSVTQQSISRPIRIERFLRKASYWSASADLASQTERVHNLSR